MVRRVDDVRPLRAGDLVHVTRTASVQFAAHPILFRVIRVLDWPAYDRWVWLDGYQVTASGNAVARRTIYVRPAGLLVRRTVTAPVPRGPTVSRRSAARRPHSG